MVKIDKTHLFNVAENGIFFILIAFSYRKVLKILQVGIHFTISAPRTIGC